MWVSFFAFMYSNLLESSCILDLSNCWNFCFSYDILAALCWSMSFSLFFSISSDSFYFSILYAFRSLSFFSSFLNLIILLWCFKTTLFITSNCRFSAISSLFVIVCSTFVNWICCLSSVAPVNCCFLSLALWIFLSIL